MGMGDNKRLGFKDNLDGFGKPFHGGHPKLRVGTFVFAGHWDKFSEHGSRESYDQAGLTRGSRGHRPTDPETMLDGEVFFAKGGDFNKDDFTTKPMGAHSHFLYLMLGAEATDEVPDDTPVDKRGRRTAEPVKKHSDDIILRFDPLVYSDFVNPETPSGMYAKAHFVQSYHWPDPNFSRLPEDIKNKTFDEIYKEAQNQFVGKCSKDYWQRAGFPPRRGMAWDDPSDYKSIGGKDYLVPNTKFYPSMMVVDHDAITIEHAPDVTVRKDPKTKSGFKETKGGFIVEFEKDGVVVGGYQMYVPEKNRADFKVNFVPKDYCEYNGLEKGEVDLIAHNGAKFERSIVYKNELDALNEKSGKKSDKKHFLDIGKDRREVLNFKAEMMTDIRYIDLMKENAQKNGWKDQVKKYDMIRNVLNETEQKIQYDDGQKDAAALKADLGSALEKIRPEIEKHEHSEPGEAGMKFQNFKASQTPSMNG
jgi:hypothetical protein